VSAPTALPRPESPRDTSLAEPGWDEQSPASVPARLVPCPELQKERE
jgi:hypothetical protein